VALSRRIAIQVLRAGVWQQLRATAGMVGVVTAVLTGSAAGLLAAVAADHSGVAGFITGGVVAVAVLVALMRVSDSACNQMGKRRLFDDEQGGQTAG
jgi:hypothetical protein